MTRLFLVDDHAILREGLRLLLSQEPNLTIVGEAVNGQHLLEQLPATPADVVLLDLNIPLLGGVATAKRLRADHPQVRILVLSMVEEPQTIQQAFAAGAHGYLLKNAFKDEVLTGIRTVLAGRRFLCSEAGLTLLEQVVGPPAPDEESAAASPLSRREQEGMRLVAQGLTTQQIADQLFTSKRTVETHRQNILKKTGARNTAALVTHVLTQQKQRRS